jgi:hypothetical protein
MRDFEAERRRRNSDIGPRMKRAGKESLVSEQLDLHAALGMPLEI